MPAWLGEARVVVFAVFVMAFVEVYGKCVSASRPFRQVEDCAPSFQGPVRATSRWSRRFSETRRVQLEAPLCSLRRGRLEG